MNLSLMITLFKEESNTLKNDRCECGTCGRLFWVSELIADFGYHNGWELPPYTEYACPFCETSELEFWPSAYYQNLLVTCTKQKASLPIGKASDIYSASATFRHLRQVADTHRFNLWIRSARYGFIRSDAIIDTYDQKLTVTPNSSYPAGDGFWCGSEVYFKDAPINYKPLLPPMTYGLLGSALQWLKVDINLRDNWFNNKPLPSVRELILSWFSEVGGTIEECSTYIASSLNLDKDFSKAIKSILYDKHKHRGFVKHKVGNRFTLVRES